LVSARTAFLVGVLVGLGLVCGSASAARGPRALTLYSVATGVQFINTADDRARGVNNNPFDSETSRLRPAVDDRGTGPFPGDVAVYTFDLYANGGLRRSAGTASYTCYFNYGKHALCRAYYELKGGTVVASGPVDFNATGFKLVLTGGTKKYLATRGQVTAVPAARNSQRLKLRLLE
jgi:hypothetical protein